MKYRLYCLILLTYFTFCKNQSHAQCSVSFNTIPTLSEGCDVLGVQFNAVINGTTLGTPVWDFGDGTALFQGRNPFHNYRTGLNDTTFSVTLTVICLDGTETNTTGIVNVFARPISTFEIQNNEICTFSDTLRIINNSNQNANYSYLWRFGDGQTSTQRNPKHVYSVEGEYEVSLEITNEKGCRNTSQKTVLAKPAPKTQFSLDSFIGCEPLFVTATNTTENSETAENIFYEWNVSNGDIIANVSPATFYFNDSGIQEINLTVRNNLGCINTTSANILVRPSPYIESFTLPSGPICYDEPLNVSVITNPSNASITWKSTDSIIIDDPNSKDIVLTLTNGGSQYLTVEMTVNGCRKDTTFEFNVVDKPTLGLLYNTGPLCEQDELVITATPENLNNYSYRLNGEDVSSNNNILTIPSLSTSNNIRLQAVDSFGCNVNTQQLIRANEKPDISFVTNAEDGVICFDQALTVSVIPAGLTNYDFFINGINEQSGALNNYTINTLFVPTEIRVIAENNQCYDTLLENYTSKLPLEIPEINCIESGLDFITYGFDLINEVQSYEISIDGGEFNSVNPTEHTITGLSADTEYTVRLKIINPAQSPCSEFVISEPVTCKTIPCERLDFTLTPTTEKICENGSVEFEITNIISSGNEIRIFWNEEETNQNTFNTGDLNSDNSPYIISASIIDDSRSPECRQTRKSAVVYIDPIPEMADFTYQYVLDENCEQTGEIDLMVSGGNSRLNYTFYRNSIDSSSFTHNLGVSTTIPYYPYGKNVILEIASPNSACKIYKDSLITYLLDETLLFPVLELSTIGIDSVDCFGDNILISNNINVDKIRDLILKYPNIVNYQINNYYKIEQGGDIIYGSSPIYDINNVTTYTYNFKPLGPGEYTLIDEILFLDIDGCPVGKLFSNELSTTKLLSCDLIELTRCSNRGYLTISDLESEYPCLYKGNNYFTLPIAAKNKLIDSTTIELYQFGYSSRIYINNKLDECINIPIYICSFPCDTPLYVPNAISPNNDGLNDKWEIKFGPVGDRIVRIYNRWEKLVYNNENYQNDFEGISDNGNILPDGVYFYELIIATPSYLIDIDTPKSIETLDEAMNKEYPISKYKCEQNLYEGLKGKLLIKR